MTVVVLAGALANKPGNGGEAWVRLAWLLGLRALGVETWFVEQIDPACCGAEHVAWFERVVRRFELDPRAALIDDGGRVLSGPPAEALHDACARADLLLNVSGNLALEPLLALPRRRAYLDLDPGYTQLWHAQGALGDALHRHEELLTVGLALGSDACPLPLGGRRWRAVPPPVPLDEWPVASEPPARGFTTVASWRGGYGRVEHAGRLHGQKAHEFRRFAQVPRDSGADCEVALDIHPGDGADAQRLADGGWRLADPRAVAGDPDAFRAYVQGSLAELSPAQGIYVETRCGWLGDRTSRYLASGRPAIVQATGLPPEWDQGEGLLTFATPQEAVAAVEAVRAEPERHARAARRLAEERLDAARVIGALLEELLP
ncbi:MAG TPA: hypothetical protein VFU94_05200 [Conexibacter sp.]|nr:hypothetical protein [Conexibacter sp.]